MKKIIRFATIPILLIILVTIMWFSQNKFHVWLLKDRGFVIAKYVGDEPQYQAEFLLISEIDGGLVVELIRGQGAENVIILKDDKAEAYLRQVEVEREDIVKR